MIQRRVDLAVMSDQELDDLLDRYKSLTRIAREVGATDDMVDRWIDMCLEIEEERAFRFDPLDG